MRVNGFDIKQLFLQDFMLDNKQKNQGSIILIAVMIMATLLTAALGTGTLVINIVNQSASIDYSISAYYAAESGVEKGLYRLRQNDYIPLVKTYDIVPDVNDLLTLDDSAKLEAHYDLTAINGKDEIIFDLVENQEYSVDLYDPLLSTASSVVPTQLMLNGKRHLSNVVTVVITILSFSQGNIHIPDTIVEEIQPSAVGNDMDQIVINIGAAHTHKIKIKIFGGSLTNLKLTAEDSLGVNTSIPGIYVLNSVGSYPHEGSRRATQVLTVDMPILESAYGLYNYVIFSEGAIDKNVPYQVK